MVSMPEDINLHRLVIWDQDFDSAAFSDYRTTGRGRYQFTGSGVISAERATCSDVTGCACRSGDSLQGLICGMVTCYDVSCSLPISAAGQCCQTCGAVLTISFTQAYRESALQQLMVDLDQNVQVTC
ncbi:protein amnionless-like [Ciona intestinalis]